MRRLLSCVVTAANGVRGSGYVSRKTSSKIQNIRSKSSWTTAVNMSGITTTEAGEQTVGLDAQQVALLKEPCILVDELDRPQGSSSKHECHLMKNINKGCFTNSCCSHPLAVPNEQEEESAIGVRRAACRRLEAELGIDREHVQPEDLTFMTRVLYKASSDGIWGEHEVDYVLLLCKDLAINPNPNEVHTCRWVTLHGVCSMLREAETGAISLSPWFKRIADSPLLSSWWENLDNPESVSDRHTIHRL
uniref:isopentenyl-diphosphate Delta-isomerase 1 isoform X2 n=1 Tax=Myxine glutinosa TaxID=7769 RepID=UPI00358E497D